VTDFEWASTSGGRSAIAVLVLSIALFGWTLSHAIRIAPVPELPVPQFAGSNALTAAAPDEEVDVGAAVETDPFSIDRSAPPARYRVPGEEDPDAAVRDMAAQPVVLGTAMSDATHSFATVQLMDDRSVIMHVGDKIGPYTIKSIERGRVVFTTTSGKKLEIPELKP
jgi:hypothetical protein